MSRGPWAHDCTVDIAFALHIFLQQGCYTFWRDVYNLWHADRDCKVTTVVGTYYTIHALNLC